MRGKKTFTVKKLLSPVSVPCIATIAMLFRKRATKEAIFLVREVPYGYFSIFRGFEAKERAGK